jgi:Bacterial Ig-like domain
MDSATINRDTFKLLDQQTLHPVDGTVEYDESTRVATFTPDARLENGPMYEATITTGVRDRSGNALAQDYAWHFTVM